MTSLLRGAAFITGAASGIGKATASSFARHGCRQIAIADISLSAAQQTAQEIEAQFSGVRAIALSTDVTSQSSINEAVEKAAHEFGRIDYAVNSAGIAGSRTLSADHDVTAWAKTLSVNLTGVWLSSRAEIIVMLRQDKLENSSRYNRGVIINVGSMYGLISPSLNVTDVSYTTSKHGVTGLTRVDAIAYAPKDIRINCICPGYVMTPLMQKAMDTDIIQKEMDKVPVMRFATMEEIADHITFLASPMSSYMFGASIVADGILDTIRWPEFELIEGLMGSDGLGRYHPNSLAHTTIAPNY